MAVGCLIDEAYFAEFKPPPVVRRSP